MTVYSEKFKKAFNYVLKNEGGYVNDPDDPGKETKYGISQRSYPNLNIRQLSLKDAEKNYFCDYWLKGKFEQIPDENVATQLFDLSVNLGIRATTIVLQRALRSVGINVQEDGLFGPVTLSGVIFSKPSILLAAIKSEAAGYYRLIAAKNPSQQRFLNGWLNRAYRQIN
ncbi:MAG: peptidoglycan-binding protein [Alphaproteobacteria bacterium]|nr:peptidoglycan-binding protein [Alphaproteobacteria bacterium]